MKNKILFPAFAVAAGSFLTPIAANGENFIEAADISAAEPKSGYDGWLGLRFGVEGSEIPDGQTVEVTRLGFFGGIGGQFAGAGTVDHEQQISLFGPQPWDTREGDYTELEIASVVVAPGNPVDGDGWSWVSLAEPVALVGGQYYVLGVNMVSQQPNDPYFDPFAGPEGAASVTAGGGIFRNGSDDTYMEGRYGLGAGQEAYNASGYLTSNFDFQVVPEPSTYAAILGGVCLLVLLRRRLRR